LIVFLKNSTLGDIYTIEGAISKAIENLNFGLTGYYQQQVTDTKNPTFLGPTFGSERVHVAGIEPEVGFVLPKSGWSASLRYAYEFTAMDHPQGNLITLAIRKSFCPPHNSGHFPRKAAIFVGGPDFVTQSTHCHQFKQFR
jgi:hypothetical protein